MQSVTLPDSTLVKRLRAASIARKSAADARETHDALKKAREGLVCPICKDLYVQPVMLGCGHTLCCDCWMQNIGRRCMCGAVIEDDAKRDYALDSVVEALFPAENAARLRESVEDSVYAKELADIRTQMHGKAVQQVVLEQQSTHTPTPATDNDVRQQVREQFTVSTPERDSQFWHAVIACSMACLFTFLFKAVSRHCGEQ